MSGIASPTYKDGTHSRVLALPPRMREQYKEAFNDLSLLELRKDIATTDARINDLLQRVDTGESSSLWRSLQAAYRDLRIAQSGTDVKALALALATVGDLITRGYDDYAAWRDVAAAIDQRRKLVESERKRLIELQQTITADKAMLLMQALLQAVRAIVSDRAQLQAIQDTFTRLTTIEGEAVDG